LMAAALVACTFAQDDGQTDEDKKLALKAEKCRCLFDAESAKISATCSLEAFQACQKEITELTTVVLEANGQVDAAKEALKAAEAAQQGKKQELKEEQDKSLDQIAIYQSKRVEAEGEKLKAELEYTAAMAKIKAEYDPKLLTATTEFEMADSEADAAQVNFNEASNAYNLAISCFDDNKAPPKPFVRECNKGGAKAQCKLPTFAEAKKDDPKNECPSDNCVSASGRPGSCTLTSLTKICTDRVDKHNCKHDVCVASMSSDGKASPSVKGACEEVCSDDKLAKLPEYKSMCEKFKAGAKADPKTKGH